MSYACDASPVLVPPNGERIFYATCSSGRSPRTSGQHTLLYVPDRLVLFPRSLAISRRLERECAKLKTLGRLTFTRTMTRAVCMALPWFKQGDFP